MEHVIANLLKNFESGRMSRRQLIQSLTVAAAAAAAPSLAFGEGGKGFKAVSVNHISYGVADYARTRDFYADLLGMKVTGDNGKQCDLSFGDTFIIPRKTRHPEGKPMVDHVAITIDDWDRDRVRTELERRGLQPRPDTDDSFHVKDPDGFDLQISGRGMKPSTT